MASHRPVYPTPELARQLFALLPPDSPQVLADEALVATILESTPCPCDKHRAEKFSRWMYARPFLIPSPPGEV